MGHKDVPSLSLSPMTPLVSSRGHQLVKCFTLRLSGGSGVTHLLHVRHLFDRSAEVIFTQFSFVGLHKAKVRIVSQRVLVRNASFICTLSYTALCLVLHWVRPKCPQVCV